MKRLLINLRNNQKGSVLMMAGILIFAILLVLSMTIDLGRVQSGYSKVDGASESSVLAAAELVMKMKTDRIGIDDNWRDFEPDQAALREYTIAQFKANFELDQNDAKILDYNSAEDFDIKYEKISDNVYSLTLSACATIEPMQLSKSAGGQDTQRTCAESTAEFSFGEVRDTETAFIIDTSAAYKPSTLVAFGGSGSDTSRFPFVQQAINDILDTYYQDPEANNYAAFTGSMYPYYDTISRKNNLSGFDDTNLHYRSYDGMAVHSMSGFYIGGPVAKRSITKEDLNDGMRAIFPVFKNAQELASFEDRPPSQWAGGGLPNYWDRYMEVRNGYFNNDSNIRNYYNNINPYLPTMELALGGKQPRKLSELQLNPTEKCSFIHPENSASYGSQYDEYGGQEFDCPAMLQPDGSPYQSGLAGNIQYIMEAYSNWRASKLFIDTEDINNPMNFLQVQPLTNKYSMLKNIVSSWTMIAEEISPITTRNSRLLNPEGRERPGDYPKLPGAAGSNALYSFIHAWLLVSEKWQGVWNAKSFHETKYGFNEDRTEIPKSKNEVSKHIIYIGSGIDMEGVKTACHNKHMPEMPQGPILVNSCFDDYYMPTENMTDNQFIAVCDKIKASGVDIHIILQGFNPIGDNYTGGGSIGGLARKISSDSLILANGQPNDRRYRECASIREGTENERSFYLNPEPNQIPAILEQIYQEELVSTANVRISKSE